MFLKYLQRGTSLQFLTFNADEFFFTQLQSKAVEKKNWYQIELNGKIETFKKDTVRVS